MSTDPKKTDPKKDDTKTPTKAAASTKATDDKADTKTDASTKTDTKATDDKADTTKSAAGTKATDDKADTNSKGDDKTTDSKATDDKADATPGALTPDEIAPDGNATQTDDQNDQAVPPEGQTDPAATTHLGGALTPDQIAPDGNATQPEDQDLQAVAAEGETDTPTKGTTVTVNRTTRFRFADGTQTRLEAGEHTLSAEHAKELKEAGLTATRGRPPRDPEHNAHLKTTVRFQHDEDGERTTVRYAAGDQYVPEHRLQDLINSGHAEAL